MHELILGMICNTIEVNVTSIKTYRHSDLIKKRCCHGQNKKVCNKIVRKK